MSEPSSTAGFVGRDDELTVFERAIAAARAGTPAVLLVGGEAGIGKSTFVAEGARRAAAELLVGRCVPIGGELIPLAPLSELLRGVRRAHPDALSKSPSQVPLRDWITRGEVANRRVAGTLFAPLLELVAALGESAAVVVAFEDLHWADTLTWELFDYLARNLVDEHVVLVGTYRADEVATNPDQRRRLGELSRLPATQRVALEGLSRTELAAKIETLTGTVPTARFVDEILARGHGNPFFSAELVAARRNGQTIPAVLSDLIAADLADLDAVAMSVVGIIAVVGWPSRCSSAALCLLTSTRSRPRSTPWTQTPSTATQTAPPTSTNSAPAGTRTSTTTPP